MAQSASCARAACSARGVSASIRQAQGALYGVVSTGVVGSICSDIPGVSLSRGAPIF